MNHKLILTILYILINLVIVFGFVAPWLISYPDTLLVIGGVVIIIGNLYHLAYLIYQLITKTNKV